MNKLHSIAYNLFLLSITLTLISCEDKITSHTKPYTSALQPKFYQDGRVEYLQADNEIIHRLVLIGDAGNADLEPGKSLMHSIAKRLKALSSKETLVFLGDNIYEDGFLGESLDCNSDSIESQKLDPQLYIGKASQNPSFFVPGNHDWDYHEEPNRQILERQKFYLEACGRDTRFEPTQNKKTALISSHDEGIYTLIFLDSHALMFGSAAEKKQSYSYLNGVFELTPPDKPVIMLAHHPIATYGPHGGCYQQDYFGHSIINFFRRNGYSWGQDVNAQEYAQFIQEVSDLIPDQHKVIFAAGHDHSLQVIQLEKGQGADFSIVSGAGSKTSPACHGENSLFSLQSFGHLEIAFRQEGQVSVEAFAYTPESKRLNKVYSQRLF